MFDDKCNECKYTLKWRHGSQQYSCVDGRENINEKSMSSNIRCFYIYFIFDSLYIQF
jgi:hypothetical protein